MKAAVLESIGSRLTIRDVQLDKPRDREVVVRTVATGLCHSDLKFIDGEWTCPTPAVLGHESAGIIESVGGAVKHVAPGDHVVVCLSAFCGACKTCLSGRFHLCTEESLRRSASGPPRITLGGVALHQLYGVGGFGEQLLVHENAVVRIPSDFPLREASLFGCSIVTGIGSVLNTARVRRGSSVAIFGLGGVGLAAVQGARIAGAELIIGVDINDAKLAMATQLGATHRVNSSSVDPVAAIQQIAGGGVDYSFEAVGDRLVAQAAFEALAPGGLATIIGLVPVGEAISIDSRLLHYERKIQGCIMGSNRFRLDVPLYIDLVERGVLDLSSLVTRYWSLGDINEALAVVASGRDIRGLLVFD